MTNVVLFVVVGFLIGALIGWAIGHSQPRQNPGISLGSVLKDATAIVALA